MATSLLPAGLPRENVQDSRRKIATLRAITRPKVVPTPINRKKEARSSPQAHEQTNTIEREGERYINIYGAGVKPQLGAGHTQEHHVQRTTTNAHVTVSNPNTFFQTKQLTQVGSGRKHISADGLQDQSRQAGTPVHCRLQCAAQDIVEQWGVVRG